MSITRRDSLTVAALEISSALLEKLPLPKAFVLHSIALLPVSVADTLSSSVFACVIGLGQTDAWRYTLLMRVFTGLQYITCLHRIPHVSSRSEPRRHPTPWAMIEKSFIPKYDIEIKSCCH